MYSRRGKQGKPKQKDFRWGKGKKTRDNDHGLTPIPRSPFGPSPMVPSEQLTSPVADLLMQPNKQGHTHLNRDIDEGEDRPLPPIPTAVPSSSTSTPTGSIPSWGTPEVHAQSFTPTSPFPVNPADYALQSPYFKTSTTVPPTFQSLAFPFSPPSTRSGNEDWTLLSDIPVDGETLNFSDQSVESEESEADTDNEKKEDENATKAVKKGSTETSASPDVGEKEEKVNSKSRDELPLNDDSREELKRFSQTRPTPMRGSQNPSSQNRSINEKRKSQELHFFGGVNGNDELFVGPENNSDDELVQVVSNQDRRQPALMSKCLIINAKGFGYVAKFAGNLGITITANEILAPLVVPAEMHPVAMGAIMSASVALNEMVGDTLHALLTPQQTCFKICSMQRKNQVNVIGDPTSFCLGLSTLLTSKAFGHFIVAPGVGAAIIGVAYLIDNTSGAKLVDMAFDTTDGRWNPLVTSIGLGTLGYSAAKAGEVQMLGLLGWTCSFQRNKLKDEAPHEPNLLQRVIYAPLMFVGVVAGGAAVVVTTQAAYDKFGGALLEELAGNLFFQFATTMLVDTSLKMGRYFLREENPIEGLGRLPRFKKQDDSSANEDDDLESFSYDFEFTNSNRNTHRPSNRAITIGFLFKAIQAAACLGSAYGMAYFTIDAADRDIQNGYLGYGNSSNWEVLENGAKMAEAAVAADLAIDLAKKAVPVVASVISSTANSIFGFFRMQQCCPNSRNGYTSLGQQTLPISDDGDSEEEVTRNGGGILPREKGQPHVTNFAKDIQEAVVKDEDDLELDFEPPHCKIC